MKTLGKKKAKSSKKSAKKAKQQHHTKKSQIASPAPKAAKKKKQATAIEKVKKFVREKFKKKPTEDQDQLEAEVIEQEEQKKKKKSSKSGDAAISFFYTNDKFMNQFEDKEIIADIQKKYPDFLLTKNDSDAKHLIIELIEDKEFVIQLLDYYNITILDFFKLIFRTEMAVFKGSFLNRMSKIVHEIDYSKQMKVK